MSQDQIPTPNGEPEKPKSRLKSFGEVAEVFVIEFYVLIIGLLIGYFWTWGNSNDKLLETFDIIVGLCIVIVCMLRFMFLARSLATEGSLRPASTEFFKELLLLLVGLVLGCLWYLYYEQTDQISTHMLVLLILIIIVLARYIALILPGNKSDEDDDTNA